jgi:hypothetical protein
MARGMAIGRRDPLLTLAINQEIKDWFGRQGSVSISYLSRESSLGTCWY